MRCLLVEDDPRTSEVQSRLLRKHGFDVIAARSAREALIAIRHDPDVILLDLGLPDSSGLTVIQEIRKVSLRPLIVVTGVRDPEARVRALDLGADDFLVKPVFARELVARIHAICRRIESAARGGHREQRIASDGKAREDLAIDYGRRVVFCQGRTVELTRTEFDIIAFLARTPGAVVAREAILDEVWGTGSNSSRSLESHIATIRRKTGESGLIRAQRGVGYVLCV
jgi:DNA-binding response OmpR family regulator